MMSKTRFTKEEILNQLDEHAREFTFPMLDNGYVYLADTRLTAYRDEFRWALLIEVLGAHHRAGGYDGINNCLHCYGNCLSCPVGTANENILAFLGDGEGVRLFDEEYQWYVNRAAHSLRLRESLIPLNLDENFLTSKEIVPEEAPQITGAELLRSLVPEFSGLLFAAESELRQRVPSDIPMILRLEEWNHPDLVADELPSHNETFQMIADVLVSGNSSLYKPTREPNTHWRNWPEGGSL
jgi:hypothetical protein